MSRASSGKGTLLQIELEKWCPTSSTDDETQDRPGFGADRLTVQLYSVAEKQGGSE